LAQSAPAADCGEGAAAERSGLTVIIWLPMRWPRSSVIVSR
jgi:hypothetical protein